MANPSLPSFVELMASLGLQDEHAANALLRGATADSAAAAPHHPIVEPVTAPAPARDSTYRQSNASLDTPLSSASLVTPLSSPPAHRDRPTSHGKKRYSPYGLNAVSTADIYTRRGSVPDILSQGHYGQDRRLHHLSAPEPYHDHDRGSNSGRATDEDGDEEMEDASAPRPQQVTNYKSPNANATSPSSSLHCAGQPNLLISRQRMPRPGVPRTKSHSHMRTTSIGASQRHQQQRPPMPSPNMPMDTERSNVNDAEGDIAVVSISSLLRRSHPQSRPVNPSGNANTAAGVAATTTGPTLSLDSPRGFQFPQVPSLPPPQLPAISDSTPSLSSESLRPIQQQQLHRTPPSAPPTKTSFGFLPGASLSGQISSTSSSLSAVRRARHARSSSARSVREMIREREGGVLLAPLHSFHPMGETEEERDNGDSQSLKPSESSRMRHRSTGQDSAHSTTTDDNRGVTPPVQTSSGPSTLQAAGSHSSFLPLDDSSRSFSHRRRAKRHTAETATAATRTGGKRSSPPPPLMLPTLPISFNIRALVGGDRDGAGDKDRLAVGEGYVSRREPHSPDPRGSWRRRVAPLEVAGM